MTITYIDKDGLLYFWQQIKQRLGDKNKIESLSFNGDKVAPDAERNVAIAEADPTVPDWAKAAEKPTYTASEVGARPSTWKPAVDDLPSLPASKVASGTLDDARIPATVARTSAIPSKVSQLSNDSGYQTASQVQSAVNAAVSKITGVEFDVVDTLPTNGRTGVFYLVPNGGADSNGYDEYIWLSAKSRFEKIGTTDVDLSGYLRSTDIVAVTNSQIDAIVAA